MPRNSARIDFLEVGGPVEVGEQVAHVVIRAFDFTVNRDDEKCAIVTVKKPVASGMLWGKNIGSEFVVEWTHGEGLSGPSPLQGEALWGVDGLARG